MTVRHPRKGIVVILLASLCMLAAPHDLFAAQSMISSASLTTSPIGTNPAGQALSSLQTASARSLWVGGRKSVEMFSLNGAQPVLSFPVEHLEDIVVDNTRSLIWVATNKEIIRYDLKGTELSRTLLIKSGELQIAGSDTRVRIALDLYDGALWMGRDREIIKFASSGNELFRLPYSQPVVDISVDVSDSSLWVGSTRLVSRFTGEGTPLVAFEPGQISGLAAVTADPSHHDVWVGDRDNIPEFNQ